LFGARGNKTDNKPKFESSTQDPEWQSIIKTIIEKPSLVSSVTEVIDPSIAGVYSIALDAVMRGEMDHPAVLQISMDESIYAMSEVELERALLHQLEIHYLRHLKQVMSDPSIPLNKKVFLRNKVQKDIIPRLKQGELIPYESDIFI